MGINSKDRLRNTLVYWLPVFLWALAIFLFSSYPTTRASQINWKDFIVKKLAHIVEYATFSILIYRALISKGLSKRKAGYYAFVFSSLYGVTDEFHQSFTPGREPTARDVIFDTIGSAIGIYLLWNLLPKMPRKLRILAEKLQLT